MIGIIVNVVCVFIGGLIGAAFSKGIPQRTISKVNSCFGISAIGMGIYSVVLVKNLTPVIFALIVGTIIGDLLHLNELFCKGGKLLQKPVSKIFKSPETISKEEYDSLLVTTIVLFCCSGTGIYGSLDAGMTGECSILMAKSVLDLFTAMIFACSLGYVTAFIAIPQIIIFSLLFMLAKFIVPLTTPVMINDFRACGGLILVATGLRIAKIKEFSIADMIPAMALVMPCSWLWTEFVVPLL